MFFEDGFFDSVVTKQLCLGLSEKQNSLIKQSDNKKNLNIIHKWMKLKKRTRFNFFPETHSISFSIYSHKELH